MRLHLDGVVLPEHRVKLAFCDVSAGDGRALEWDAEPLHRTVEGHLRPVETHRETVRRALGGESSEPIRPLHDTDVALDQLHLDQVLWPLQGVR